MSKGIIASQLHFTRGATNFEFTVHYGDLAVGTVIRKGAGKNIRWEIEDKPEYWGVTREEAATRLLSSNLAEAIQAPILHHRWLPTVKGEAAMRYACSKTGQTYTGYSTTDTLNQLCQGCGEPLCYSQAYAAVTVFSPTAEGWKIVTR